MPTNYRYPGKSDIEGTVKQGEMSDVNASSLYREGKEGDLMGSTNAKFSQFVKTSKSKMMNNQSAVFKMADDHSLYSTSGK
jgi:hypothetical protein|tara:strand:- start:2367 stop:2609 length:243 start_codon:yes stop_codon:yes gene_type:complete